MNTFVKGMIQELYEQANENSYRQASQKMLSVSMDCNEASLIKAIADHFNQSVSNFCSEILSNAVREALLYLEPEDRTRVAFAADNISFEHEKKQGISSHYLVAGKEVEGCFYWRCIVDPEEPSKTLSQFELQQEVDGEVKK